MSTEVQILSSMAMRQILAEVALAHERAIGRKVVVTSIGGVDAAKRVRAGEACDVVILAADALLGLADEGFISANTVRAVALSPTAVAVKAGREVPVLSDAAAVEALVRGAAVVGVSTGPSGTAVKALLERWGYPGRVVTAPPGVPVARLITAGEAEVGFQQLSELQGEEGVVIAGNLSTDLMAPTVFAAGVSRTARHAGAMAFIAALMAAGNVMRAHGMSPAAA